MNIRELKRLLDIIDMDQYGDDSVSFIAADCAETHVGIASDMVKIGEYDEFAEKFRDSVGPDDLVFVIPKREITTI